VAAEAGAGRLVLTHLDVCTADPLRLGAAAAGRFPAAEVGEDGAVLLT
jgi:ribonuclease BN (tRNA processing enzyme)